jgi:hypothetical protein
LTAQEGPAMRPSGPWTSETVRNCRNEARNRTAFRPTSTHGTGPSVTASCTPANGRRRLLRASRKGGSGCRLGAAWQPASGGAENGGRNALNDQAGCESGKRKACPSAAEHGVVSPNRVTPCQQARTSFSGGGEDQDPSTGAGSMPWPASGGQRGRRCRADGRRGNRHWPARCPHRPESPSHQAPAARLRAASKVT